MPTYDLGMLPIIIRHSRTTTDIQCFNDERLVFSILIIYLSFTVDRLVNDFFL